MEHYPDTGHGAGRFLQECKIKLGALQRIGRCSISRTGTLLAMLVTLGVILTGCGGCGNGDKPIPPDASTKIGVILPLSGDASSYGVDCRRGIELAAEGSNIKVEFLFEDSKADPKSAISAFNKLTAINQASVVIGDMFSSTTLAIAPIAQEKGVVLLTPTAADEKIPAIGDCIFSIYPSASAEGKFMAGAIPSDSIANVVVLYQNQTATKGIADAFAAGIAQRGGKVALVESITEETSGYRSILEKASAAGPTCIFISAYRDPVASMIAMGRELGIDTLYASQSTLYDEKALQDYAGKLDSVILSGPFFDEANEAPAIRDFIERYTKKYGEAPSVWAAYGYDSASIMISAIHAKNGGGLAVKDSLAKLDHEGLTGRTTMGPGRNVSKEMAIYIIKDNRFVRQSE